MALRVAGMSALAAIIAVSGPGLLAGLSDDDPAGVTTYSILGAHFGYVLLWTIPFSTLLLIGFHLLAVRLGILSGSGFTATVRRRYGRRAAWLVAAFFVLANLGTVCAEFAGIAAAGTLAGIPTWVSAPLGALVVGVLVVGATFHRVERVLLAVSALLASYVVAAVLARPDWGAAGAGLVTPTLPSSRAGMVAVTATVGTTLAPWGLSFIQSYSVDKGLHWRDWTAERVEVIIGSVLTGLIGTCIAITCAAVLWPAHIQVTDAHEAAQALRPLAGRYASVLFGVGLIGAGLLGAALVPLSTAYSVVEGVDHPGDLDAKASVDKLFYGIFVAILVVCAGIVALPGVRLIPLIYFSQLVNAVFLPPELILLVMLNRDPAVVGERRLPAWAAIGASAGVVVVVAALVALGLTQLGALGAS